MKYFKRIVLFCLLLLNGNFLFCQAYYARHYQVENGLSNNAVICSLVDKQGFLWFGTKDGLNRFDGYAFKVFRNNPETKGSIGSNFIHTLYQDDGGTLWIGTENGLFTYNATAESFTEFETPVKGSIRDIKGDKKGNIWFITGFTLFRHDVASKINTAFAINDFFEATSIEVSKEGTVWVSTTTGHLCQYHPDKNNFSHYDLFNHSPKAVSKWIEKIQCSNGSILVGTATQGAKIFDINAAAYKDILTYNTDKTEIFVRNFIRTSDTEVWIATESGIYIYNTVSGATTNLQKKYNDPYSISDNAVYTFCKDNEGGIWAGTYFGGVNYYPKQITPFKKYFPKAGENSLSGNVIREMQEDRYGNFWIGTEDAGLNKFEKSTGKLIHFLPTGNKQSISYTNIHGLLASGNELWIGTFEHGVDVMNITSGKVIRRYQAGTEQPAIKSNFFYCIYQTILGEILLGTTRGALRFNRATNKMQPVAGLPEENWYTSILETDSGILWASTWGNGVYKVDTKTGITTNYLYAANKKGSLSNNRVNSVFEDSEKNIWFATEGGLCKYVKADDSFKRYTTTNRLPGNFILSMLEDAQKNLWISTTKGLVQLNIKTDAVTFFTVDNGLLSNQFNFSSAYKTTDGRMYFGSAKGLISFHPNEIIKPEFVPPVYLTGFQVHNQELPIALKGSPLQKSIAFTQKITLSHRESTFSLDFAALSYTAPQMLEYTYKMEGLDKDWVYLESNRKVYFTELSAGTYVFRVKASNNRGIWSNSETKLVIEILPPWWASWWAYCFYVLVSLGILLLVIRNYHNRVEQKNRRKAELLEAAKEKEIYEAKIEFFTNVAHEIRTPLTLIKGPLEKVIKKADAFPDVTNHLKIIEKNTDRLIDLTNQLLDFRQTEIKGFSLSFVKINISDILVETFQNFKPLAEQKNLEFEMAVAYKSLYVFIDPDAFNKILYNLFSNAIKYAEKKVIVTLLPVTDNALHIEFANDGFLIPYDKKESIFQPFFRLKETARQRGTGIGLALARSLARLHKGELSCLETLAKQNVFLLSLPLYQENEAYQDKKNNETTLETKANQHNETSTIIS